MGGARRSSVMCAMCIMVTAAAGCASATTSGVATSAHGVPAPTVSATADCAGRPVTITLADNDKTLCATSGTTITVLLRGTPGSRWEPAKSDSTVLVPRADPRLALEVGMTGTTFVAARPGKAVISSARFPCRMSPAAPSTAGKNMLHCGVIVGFHATVIVERDQ